MDEPNGKKIVGHVRKGESVLALTGEVHSIPLRVVIRKDSPEEGVTKGDVVYILHYSGEGYWAVWQKGKVIQLQNFSDKAPFPRATWWVQLKTKQGVVGWVISHNNFSNQDACG